MTADQRDRGEPGAAGRRVIEVYRHYLATGRSSTRAVPDDLRSPIKHHLVLHRIDPEQGIRRFYSLMIERDLFGTVRLVRNWGRIGTNGQELVEIHEDEIEAGARWRRSPGRSAGGAIGICEPCAVQTYRELRGRPFMERYSLSFARYVTLAQSLNICI